MRWKVARARRRRRRWSRARLSPNDAAIPPRPVHLHHLRGQRLARLSPLRHGRGGPRRLRRPPGGGGCGAPAEVSPPVASRQQAAQRAASPAGPLVGGAVLPPPRFRHPLLRDSKLLSARQRETVAEALRRDAVSWAVAEVGVDEINSRGLGWAHIDIFRRLVDAVT